MIMTDFIQVITTTESQEAAQKIAEQIVRRRLAACAQVVGPIQSTYWWEGELKQSQEWICVLKTRLALYDRLESELVKIHPYDTPEILALPIIAGYKKYCDWLLSETDDSPPSP